MRLSSTTAVIALCFSVICAHAQNGMSARAHVIIYKTRKDYRKYVPVTLSADKKTVVSYPDPTDIKTGSGPANSGPLPVLLHKGYLLDKRGVDKNTAFIKMTYSEYAALKLPPSPTALYGMIIDKNPLTALYDCGPRDPVKNDVQQLEAAIDHHQLHKRFKQIK